MEPLNQFYNSDKKEAFYDFFVEVLKEETAKRVFERKDVSGIADAKELLDKVYDKLKRKYAPKLEADPKVINPTV